MGQVNRSIVSEASFPIRNLFVSAEKVFVFPRYSHLLQTQWYTVLFCSFALYLSYYASFISVLVFLFYRGCILSILCMFFSLCLMRSQQTKSKRKILPYLRMLLLSYTLCHLDKSKTRKSYFFGG